MRLPRLRLRISNCSLLQKSLCYCIVYCYNGAQRYEQFLQAGWLYQAVMFLGLALYLLSTSCLRSSCCYIHSNFFAYIPTFSELSWAWWDWPLTWLTNHRPSVLWHCWLGHLTHKIVLKMTYNVWSGTLLYLYCYIIQVHRTALWGYGKYRQDVVWER